LRQDQLLIAVFQNYKFNIVIFDVFGTNKRECLSCHLFFSTMPLLLQTLSKLDWDSRAAGMELTMWSNLCWWGEMTCWMVGSFNSILTLIQGCCLQIVLRGLKKPWSYLGVFCCLQWDQLGVEKERCFCGVGWLNASTPTRQSLSLILGGMNGDLFCGHNLLCQEIIVACANVTFCGHYLMPGKSIMLAQKVTLRDCFILVVYYLWRWTVSPAFLYRGVAFYLHSFCGATSATNLAIEVNTTHPVVY
jgi:hypothetical protein